MIEKELPVMEAETEVIDTDVKWIKVGIHKDGYWISSCLYDTKSGAELFYFGSDYPIQFFAKIRRPQ